ncbi:MAG: PKD domain-containing protein [Anaerolineae bacterium]|nr:PKD domain-containing protein [Anaerolineae bacterium]
MASLVIIACIPKDTQQANTLADALRAAGTAVHIADDQPSLLASLKRTTQPQQVIMLLSRAAVDSTYMRGALRLFHKHNVQIIPVLIESLAGEQLNFRYFDASRNTEQRLQALARQLGGKQREAVRTPHPVLNLLALGGTLLGILLVVAVLVLGQAKSPEPMPTLLMVALEVSPTPSVTSPIDLNSTAAPSPTAETIATSTTTVISEVTAEATETVEATSDVVVVGSAQAAFVADPLSGYAPLVVTFSNASAGDITGYAWDFDGDGRLDSDERDPLPFTYTEPGGYQASLTVTFADGTMSSAVEFFEVYPAESTDSSLPSTNTNPATTTSKTAIVASFAAQPSAGAIPLTVSFTNQSSGTDIRYAWDFNGDGETDSTRRDPGPYTYREAGQYEVRLRVSTLAGETTEHWMMIQAGGTGENSNLVAAFVPRPATGPAPLVVTFSNHSFGDAISAYAWDFNGDGVTDSTAETPPAYIYQTSGMFTASLRVTGAGGKTITQTRQITVETPPAPIAAFSASPFFGTAPQVVTFTNYSAGVISSYAWDFNGDGVTDSTVASPPPYIYSTPGLHTIQLTVSGPGGTSEPAIEYVIVEEAQMPSDVTAQFSVTPISGTAPLTVTFNNTSTGSIASYAWDFNGDGVTDSSDRAPLPFTFTEPGNYTVTLTVTGVDGSSQSASQSVVVSAPIIPASAAFALSPAAGTAPLVVSFTNLSTGDIASYAWDFNGDGSSDSSDRAPLPLTFTEPGSYTITLTVTGVDGSTQSASQSVVVSAPIVPASAAFALSPAAGTAPLVVSFTNLSTGDITSYAWDFNGDGSSDSSDRDPLPFTFTEPGSYTVTLTVTGVDGSSQSASQSVVVRTPIVPASAAFALSPATGTAPLVVSFTNLSTGDIASYAWDFNGDGSSDSSDRDPLPFTFTEPGSYTITLTVTGVDGSSQTTSQSVTVDAAPPTEGEEDTSAP